MQKKVYIAISPNTDIPLVSFAQRRDAEAWFQCEYPSQSTDGLIVAVPYYCDGYLGYQRRKDRKE